ncbi:MAG TPA: B12-binding domain-containing radical SAM protein [Acidobacteria bacterium]|nr:B12-binding domain-containing radical SAM protein [Acidobacteriota bacterium]
MKRVTGYAGDYIHHMAEIATDLTDSLSTQGERRLTIALVWPKGFDPTYSIPLPYGYFKNNLDKDRYEIVIIDNAIEGRSCRDSSFLEELRACDPDVVGVSTWSPMFIEALEVLQVAKEIKPSVVTVMGGAHASSYFKRIIGTPQIDFIIRGEAERSFGEFLDQLQTTTPDWTTVKGLVYPVDDGYEYNDPDLNQDLDSIAIPDYEAIQLERYVKAGYRWNSPPTGNAPIWVTRGCPYRCQYCAAPDLNGRPVRTHSIEYMMNWIKYLYDTRKVRWFNIIDDNFTYHVKYAKEFCRAVIDLDLDGVGFGTPNGVRMERGDPELWQLMKQAGWQTLMVAPESGSAHTLALMKKDLAVGLVPKAVQDIRNAGLKVQGFFIIGYPGETIEDLEESVKLIMDCKFNFVFLNSFQPLPGTPVYDALVEQGEIPDGLLPNSYSDGKKAYIAKELKDFNYSKFILMTHLKMMWNDPGNIPFHFSLMFKRFSPTFVLKKVGMIFWNMCFPKQQIKNDVVFEPMHHTGQVVASTVLGSK